MLPAFQASNVAARFAFAALVSAAFLFALRFRREPEAGARSGLVLVSAALIVWPAALAGILLFMPDGISPTVYGIFIVQVVALAALWLANVPRAGSRGAVGLALFLLGAVLAGMVLQTEFGGLRGLLSVGLFGAIRTLAVGLLAYAILRHKLLGIDVKVRWTIQKSTIAAAFVGVFFVVSEGAQQLFSEGAGPMVGVVAAGALVFAMAPLQRAAERVAQAAIPAVRGAAAEAPTGRAPEESFRFAVRMALKDGLITPQEDRELVLLAERLGLGAEQAYDIRDAVASEPRGTRAQAPGARRDPR